MDHQEMLKQEFLDRKARRPAYSERAFARDLKISPGYINLLFSGRRSLSPAKGLSLAQRLGWSEEKTQAFVFSIQQNGLKHGSPASPRHASPKFSNLEHDTFRFIADLNHLAILTLVQSRAGVTSAEAQRAFGLSAVETELILNRLDRLALIRLEKGKYMAKKKSVELKAVPSEAVRAFHRQAIQKAESSIEQQAPAIRNLAALTLSFDPDEISEAKAFIKRFLKSFEKKFGHARKGEVYQLNTQLFKLTQEKK